MSKHFKIWTISCIFKLLKIDNFTDKYFINPKENTRSYRHATHKSANPLTPIFHKK